MEEFALRFLDPLKHDFPERYMVGIIPNIDGILEKAIKLDLKKVFFLECSWLLMQ